MIPLYQIGHLDWKWEDLIKSKTAHPGLLFDKFPDGWKRNQKNYLILPDGDNGAKEKLYTETVNRCKKHLQAGLTHTIERQKKLIIAHSGETLELQTDWRLITGLGNSHPYETGFSWHRTLGVPYLSGSSVKGLLRDWITHWAEEGGEEEANRLLGSNRTDDPDNNQLAIVGSVIIFDALPVRPPKLEVDILNPHYQPYYSDPEKKPPADYYNPVPIKFLTVAARQDFLFSLAPRKPKSCDPLDIQKCLNYLLDALETLGAGGKTAVGYGILTESLKANRERTLLKVKEKTKYIKKLTQFKTDKAIAQSGLPEELSPMIKQLNEENWNSDNAKFYVGAEHWIPIIQQQNDVEIQEKAAQKLADILEELFKGIIKNPNKTKGRRNKPIYKPKPVSIALKLLEILNK